MKKTKKFLCLMMTLLLTLSSLLGNNSVLDVKAKNGATQILKGTPLFDGQLDDMYKETLTLSTGVGENAYNTPWADNTGNIYFLYDDTYLYICADIKDDSVCSRGDIYVAGYNPNQNDNCEFRLCLNSNIEGVTPTTIKVGIDAYGIRAYGLDDDMAATDYSKIQYKTTRQDEGENSGYVIEAAIPHTDGGILDLLKAGQLGFKEQLNDLDYDGSYYNFAPSRTGEGPKDLVYYDLSEQMVTGGDVNTPPEMIKDEVVVTDYLELSFAADGNSVLKSGTGFGSSTQDTEKGIINIGYGNMTTQTGGGSTLAQTSQYMAKVGFNAGNIYSTYYKYVRVLYSATNPTNAENVRIKLYNDGTGNSVTFDGTVTNTNGEFVLSSAALMTDDMAERYATQNAHMSLLFLTTAEGGSYQVKSFYFFKTEEEANNFELPSDNEKIDYQKLSFADPAGYYKPENQTGYGNSEVNTDLGTIDFKYGNIDPSKNYSKDSQYVGKVGFPSEGVYDGEYKFIRVLYSATNPTGVDGVQLKLYNDGGGSNFIFTDTIKNTNGEFILSSTGEMTMEMIERYKKRAHMSLLFMTEAEGADYKVKAFYFFKTKEDADKFTPTSELTEIQINGNDISKYQVVVPVDGIGNEIASAQSIVAKIYELSEVTIPIVNDGEASTDYEILIGDTNRTESSKHYDTGGQFHPSYEKFSVAPYYIERVGNKLVFVAASSLCMDENAVLFNWLLNRGAESGEGVNITADGVVARGLYTFSPATWPEVTNVPEPVQFTDNFDTDEGYWTTDSEKQGWTITDESENKVFSTGNSTSALSYLHVYEKNVSFETKLKATVAQSGQVGLLLRHTADHAYIKAGYDFTTKEWFIDVREGEDFMLYRLASKAAEFTADWYNVKVVVDGETATLFVNEEKMVETDDLVQHTPGKIGVFADGVSAMVDDINISLLSGQGTFWKNVVHTKLPGESYREGGTVVEMKDGSLIYQSRSYDNATFTSTDSGKTWVQADEMWSDALGCPNILRLKTGELLRINQVTLDDGQKWQTAEISTDDGVTWNHVGQICTRSYKNYGENVVGSNMNDKITQMSDGRIFYVQSYETRNGVTFKGCSTFCEIYYSDNKGATWTKSTMDTYDIEGNQVSAEHPLGTRFAECKILETAEGKLRMYNSHNDYGYIVYSESTDNGKTWGPLHIMTEFMCSTSSMQFVKDTYADNETTYYMVWVKNDKKLVTGLSTYPRSRLAVAKSTDGINWVSLGEAWRWECHYSNGVSNIQHIVDPFIKVTEDYLLVGSGISEKTGTDSHQAQRQHIWSVEKSSLEENTWESDDTSHWQESVRGDKVNVTVHTTTGDNVAICPEKAVCDICEAEYIVHNFDKTTWKSDANGHWHECTCQAKADKAAHTPGAAATATAAQTCTECGYVITSAIGDTSDSSDASNSSDTSDSSNANDSSDTHAPDIVESATDDSYTLGSNGEVTIKTTGEFSKFESVEMDDEIVDKSNYSVKEGSTIITFKNTYLETLSVGKHTVTINYKDGSDVDAKLTILKKTDADTNTDSNTEVENESDNDDTSVNEDDNNTFSDEVTTKVPSGAVNANSTKTGDTSNLFLWIMLAAGAMAMAVFLMYLRKKSN